MANRSPKHSSPANQGASQESVPPQGPIRKHPDRAFRSSVAESWTAFLKDLGMAPHLVKLVEIAEFEQWTKQVNHQIGNGLYYSELQDMPPRMQKKVFELATKIANERFARSIGSEPLPPSASETSSSNQIPNTRVAGSSGNMESAGYVDSCLPSSSSEGLRNSNRSIGIENQSAVFEETGKSDHHNRTFKRTTRPSSSFSGRSNIVEKTCSKPENQSENVPNGEGFSDEANKVNSFEDCNSRQLSAKAMNLKHAKHSAKFVNRDQTFKNGTSNHDRTFERTPRTHSFHGKQNLRERHPLKHEWQSDHANQRTLCVNRESKVLSQQQPRKNKTTDIPDESDYSYLNHSSHNSSYGSNSRMNNLSKNSNYQGHNNNRERKVSNSSSVQSSNHSEHHNGMDRNKKGNKNFLSSKTGQSQWETSSCDSSNSSKLHHLSNSSSPSIKPPRPPLNGYEKVSAGSVSMPQSYSKSQCYSRRNNSFNFEPTQKKSDVPQGEKLNAKTCDPCIKNLLNVIESREKRIGSPNSCIPQQDHPYRKLVIEVSENVEDTIYWKPYLKEVLGHDHFQLNAASTDLEGFYLSFPDSETMKNARNLLEKKSRNLGKGPHIRKVSYFKQPDQLKISKGMKESIDKVLNKEVEKSVDSIQTLFLRYITLHNEKIESMENELSTLKPCNDKFSTVESKLKALKAMKGVFLNFADETKNKIIGLERKAKNFTKAVDDIKNDFVRECSCFDGILPIYAKKEEILDVVRNNRVSIIVADTGSGKSTQLVQYLFRDGYASSGTIICTQPRKIAAITLSQYISTQMGSVVGELVGYETGVRKKVSRNTKISYMTDYTLLRKCLRPNEFSTVSCVVVDEAHERSLYTDLLLGMLKRLMKSRKDLKLVITSATIDPRTFMFYFNVPAEAVVRVPGQVYPVEVIWREDVAIGWNYVKASVDCAYHIHCSKPDGAILIFLTSPTEIEEAISLFKEMLGKKGTKSKGLTHWLLALHGKLSAEDQLKIFEPSPKNHRKIIFATNSAETSLTIPDIKYVVDSGMAKELHYDKEKKRSALVIGFVSRSSATQRKGRAGRTQAGVCYRLYSENNYKKDMLDCHPPEILRCPLDQALLKIMELKIDPYEFDFLSVPPKSCIDDAMFSLQILGCVHENHLTDLGKKVAKLPLNPQLGKLVINGIDKDIGYEMAVIAALASVSGLIFTRNEENKIIADKEKVSFCHELGDFYTYLIVFHEWVQLPKPQKNSWCSKHFINPKAMQRTEYMVEELCLTIWNELKISVHQKFNKSTVFSDLYEPLLFECFSENIFVYSGHDRAGYLSPNLEGSFFIHPSSSLSYLSQQLPKFVVCNTVLKTSRNFLLNVTPVSEDTIVKAFSQEKFFFPIELLKRLQVSPIVYKPVGEVLLVRHFIGKEGVVLKQLEDQLRCVTMSSTFHISVSVQDGEITAYCQPHHRNRVSCLIDKALEVGRQTLSKEEELFSASRDIHFTFALASAANVHDVILPGESREVIVKYCYGCNLKKANYAKILEILESYGPLVSHKLIQDSYAVLATFVKVSYAENALKGLQNNKTYEAAKGRTESLKTKDDQPLYRIFISWNRLSCKGTGSIEFDDSAQCIEACCKLNHSTIYVGDNYLVIEASKTSTKLTIRNLPSYAVEEDVMSTLKEHLPTELKIKSITLQRENAFRVTQSQLEEQKRKLLQIFGPFSSPKNIYIEIRKPEENDPKWSGIVYFRQLEECQKALSELQDKIMIGKHKANMFLMVKSIMHCKPDIYSVLRKDIEACGTKYRKLESSCKIQIEKRYRDCVITISCGNLKRLAEMRSEIINLLEGQHILCGDSPKLSKLFEHRSRISFEEIEKATKTLIRINNIQKIISIFGSKASCMEAKNLITNASVGSSIIKTKIFNLHGEDLPIGFVKELYKLYGYSLHLFIKKFGLKWAYIDFQKHQLALEGTYKNINEAENHLEDICSKLAEKQEEDDCEKEDTENCPVCFDKISQAEAIRLENCGHAVCKLCLQLQLKSKLFPVICSKEGCGKPFFVEDFRKILGNEPSIKLEFALAALENYIQLNPSEVRYCPVPDCPMIYRVTTEQNQVFCHGCENYICTHCHTLFHHGMNCEMFQNTRVDEDYPLKAWLKADATNRKCCPNCSTAIEKIGGCSHVVCSQCQKHFCWMCLEVFETNDEVYDHIPNCPSS